MTDNMNVKHSSLSTCSTRKHVLKTPWGPLKGAIEMHAIIISKMVYFARLQVTQTSVLLR